MQSMQPAANEVSLAETADIAGGRKMGMKTCWYDREKTGRSDEADVTIQNLCILKEIL